MSGSVGQPNFDDLYKFLVSFGLTAIIGAGAIPWLLQQLSLIHISEPTRPY